MTKVKRVLKLGKSLSLSALIALSLITLQGCSFPGVYKLNVQQGNIVTQEMLDQLRPGMTKKQVHFVLGNPVVSNIFNDSAESYLYSYQREGTDTQSQTIVIRYQDGLYSSYEGQPLEEHKAY